MTSQVSPEVHVLRLCRWVIRRVKPTPYNNNAKKHPLAQSEEPKPHPAEIVEIKPVEEPKAEPEDEDISLVERWDDVEIRIKPND